MEVKEWIESTLGVFSKFADLTTIHALKEDGALRVVSMGKHKSMMLELKTQDPGLPAPICFGNLKYLQKIISIEQVKTSGEVSCNVTKAIDGTDIIKSIDFVAPRLKVRYEATDPRVAETQPTSVRIDQWPTKAALQPSHYKEISDAVALQKVANPAKVELKLEKDAGELVVVLETGERMSDKDIRLSLGPVDGDVPADFYLNTAKFLSAVALASESKSGATLLICDKAAKLEVSLEGPAKSEMSAVVVFPRNTTVSR